ncbi:KEOPS complex subunit Pcc1 [Natronobeatus ordinarius]|uniref:KEOPS complex subunit Pcc1 n=1 Tax=Natronobeatus ordinarius TaxID=2963433 RepID=UPI0020CDC892|nr:KEOPS complex subunit Pcc1 [Natronobeatus ordinarius]
MSRRRATIRTEHDEPDLVARAIQPDNTDEMATEVEGDAVVTRIERGTTGGLHATVDDYVVNLDVANTVVQCEPRMDAREDASENTDTNHE